MGVLRSSRSAFRELEFSGYALTLAAVMQGEGMLVLAASGDEPSDEPFCDGQMGTRDKCIEL